MSVATAFNDGTGAPGDGTQTLVARRHPFVGLMGGLAMEWKDQYKHPMWQKRRLERLEASNFTCEQCDASEKQLHVHHRQYFKGRKIWEYSDMELQVLCEDCHSSVHATLDKLKEALSRAADRHIEGALGFLHGTLLDDYSDGVKVDSFEHAAGIAAAFGIVDGSEVYRRVIDNLDEQGRITCDAIMRTIPKNLFEKD